jgi:hypothetical protein
VREKRLVVSVVFIAPRELVHSRVAEDDLISGFFVIAPVIVSLPFDLSDTELFYDFLDTILEETFVRENLLGNESVLLEIAVDHFPRVFLVDWIHGAHLFKVTH